MTLHPAIFLDKDGTLVPDIPYNVQPGRIQLVRGAAVVLPQLVRAGYQLIVISNQSGVARGKFPESALGSVERRLRALLHDIGVPLAGFYYCPHHPEGSVAPYAVDCDCRKPAPGLLLQAARELDIAIERSWMIGDILNDVEAAHRAGCRAALLLNGGETMWDLSPPRVPDIMAPDLESAANRILSLSRLQSEVEWTLGEVESQPC
jgi:D-glycero-D-manno-heptose 1,7-bisphosphate phosphatase